MKGKESKGEAFFVSFLLSYVTGNLNTKEKLMNFQSKSHLHNQSNTYSLECNLLSTIIYVLDETYLVKNVKYFLLTICLHLEKKRAG